MSIHYSFLSRASASDGLIKLRSFQSAVSPLWLMIAAQIDPRVFMAFYAQSWQYLSIFEWFLASCDFEWWAAEYTLGREYPTMGHGDMFSGIVTPLALSLTFCIMIGKTLAKWFSLFPSEPCNLGATEPGPWSAVVVLEGEPKRLLLPMLATDQRHPMKTPEAKRESSSGSVVNSVNTSISWMCAKRHRPRICIARRWWEMNRPDIRKALDCFGYYNLSKIMQNHSLHKSS